MMSFTRCQQFSVILILSVSLQIAQPAAVLNQYDGDLERVNTLLQLLGEDVETDVNKEKREIISGVSDGTVHTLSEEDVKELCLNAHNYVRSLHPGVPPLTWSSDLARGAEDWAAYLAGEGSIRHASSNERKEACNGSPCGENIYSMGRAPRGEVPDSANAVFAWYNEWICWDYELGVKITTGDCGSNPVTGHLTQRLVLSPRFAWLDFDESFLGIKPGIIHLPALWRDSTEVGCGIATVSQDFVNRKGKLKENKFQYSVIVARYLPPGNINHRYTSRVPAPEEGAALPTSADDLRDKAEAMTC